MRFVFLRSFARFVPLLLPFWVSPAFGWNKPGVGSANTIKQALTGHLPLTRGWTISQLYDLASELAPEESPYRD